MRTVQSVQEMSARIVAERIEVDRLRWFQTQRYVDAGLLKELPLQLPPDPHAASSTYIGVYCGDEIVATARLVASDRPEIIDHHKFFPHIEKRFEGYPVVEVSRLAVSKNSAHYSALRVLFKELVLYALNGPPGMVILGSVEKPMVRILDRMFAVPIQVVGPEISQYGEFAGATVPIMLDTRYGLRVLREQRRREAAKRPSAVTDEHVVELSDDLVIDLTDEPFSNSMVSSRKTLLDDHSRVGV